MALRFKKDDGTDYPEWEQKKLGDVAIIVMGQSPNSSNYNMKKIGLPLIQGNADCENRKTQPKTFTSQITKECDIGDIIMSVRAPVGSISMSIHNACIGRGVCCIKHNNEKLQAFLYQILVYSERLWGSISQGSTFESVGSKDIYTFPLNVPKAIEEQEKIALLLSNLDNLIHKTEDELNLLKKLEKSIMQHLFKNDWKMALRFKKNDGTDYPEWEEKKLGEVADCLDHLRVPLNENERNTLKGNIPYCGANGILDYINKYQIDDNIILLAEDGGHFNEYETKPIAYRMSGKCWVNNHAHILKAKPSYAQDLLFFLLEHKNILSFLSGGTRQKLNKAEMLKIPMNLPKDFLEQEKIATLLSDVDNLIHKTEDKLNLLKKLKKSIMQQLFKKD